MGSRLTSTELPLPGRVNENYSPDIGFVGNLVSGAVATVITRLSLLTLLVTSIILAYYYVWTIYIVYVYVCVCMRIDNYFIIFSMINLRFGGCTQLDPTNNSWPSKTSSLCGTQLAILYRFWFGHFTHKHNVHTNHCLIGLHVPSLSTGHGIASA